MRQRFDRKTKTLLILENANEWWVSIYKVRIFHRYLAKIVDKEEAAARRAEDIKIKKQEERRLQRELQSKRQKNAKIKKYFNEYQTGLRKSLTKKKYQGIILKLDCIEFSIRF